MRIVIFGGSGFIGEHLAATLASRGHSLVIPVRNRESVKNNLILLPQTDVLDYSPSKPATIAKMLAGADAVVNLVGILNENSIHNKFDKVHGEFVRLLSEACKTHAIRHFIQISAIGASSNAPSNYLRSKAKGEAIVRSGDFFRHVILRLSVVFGTNDRFVNQFAGILRYFPVVPLPCAYAKMQPIAVDDVVALIIRALEDDSLINVTWHAGGPEILELREIVAKIAEAMQVRRKIIPLNHALSYAAATVAEFAPFSPDFSRDNCLSAKVASVCPKNDNAAKTHLDKLTSLETMLSARFDKNEKSPLGRFRSSARR